MVQLSRQHVAPCVKGIEWAGIGHKRVEAALWAGISVEITQEAGVDPRCRRAAIVTPF